MSENYIRSIVVDSLYFGDTTPDERLTARLIDIFEITEDEWSQ